MRLIALACNAFRVHDPKWSFAPVSGVGAAMVIGDLVMSTGTKGILFDSVITGGSNLVLYTDMLASNDVIKPYDPTQSLPRDQASWH